MKEAHQMRSVYIPLWLWRYEKACYEEIFIFIVAQMLIHKYYGKSFAVDIYR